MTSLYFLFCHHHNQQLLKPVMILSRVILLRFRPGSLRVTRRSRMSVMKARLHYRQHGLCRAKGVHPFWNSSCFSFSCFFFVSSYTFLLSILSSFLPPLSIPYFVNTTLFSSALDSETRARVDVERALREAQGRHGAEVCTLSDCMGKAIISHCCKGF